MQVRRGFTLIELAVVLALLGIVGAAVGSTLVRQQRFYRGASELIYARESVRDALDVLSSDIRGLAVADTVRLLADSAMEFFAGIGSSVVCQTVSGVEIGLPGPASSGNTITSLSTQPDTGDLAVFYRSGGDTVPDTWERHRISGFASRTVASSCGDTAGIASGAGGRGFVATLSSGLTGGIARGTPVRFIRRGRYSLYHASDGAWYLGYRRCNAVGASVCGGIQPLSGPYRSYSADGERTGLLLEYFDSRGVRLGPGTSPLSLARVDVTARAESREQVPLERGFSRPADSASISIAVRNREP
ncbi:MAG TPA: type II secretion system protein [Gemmatimonadaceae bacterium]|nr:type II secretion system protein [Gemmatimonadaceae bacterium]